jgi:2,3-bisphosphoglycerate-dependent phosphoglycerate mutase
MFSSVIALVRHGQYHQIAGAPSAFQPFSLNEEGREQALACLPGLLEFSRQGQLPIAAKIHTSVMLRAWQTADIIRQQLVRINENVCYSLEQTVALGERCVGSVANLTVAHIEQILVDDPRYSSPPENWKASSDYLLPFPGAESLQQAGLRVANYLREIISTQNNNYPQGCLHIVVGHGAAFRHAACELGVMKPEQIAKLSMYHATPVFLQQVSPHGWRHVAGEWKVRQSSSEDLD